MLWILGAKGPCPNNSMKISQVDDLRPSYNNNVVYPFVKSIISPNLNADILYLLVHLLHGVFLGSCLPEHDHDEHWWRKDDQSCLDAYHQLRHCERNRSKLQMEDNDVTFGYYRCISPLQKPLSRLSFRQQRQLFAFWIFPGFFKYWIIWFLYEKIVNLPFIDL